MPALVPRKPPPPDYYARNLRTILDHARERHADLLTADELGCANRLSAASTRAQRLFARLMSRKGPWLRIDKLSYTEIDDLDDALTELAAAGLVTINAPAPADVLLGLLTQPERKTLVPGIRATTRRAWILECVGGHPDVLIRRLMAERFPWVGLSCQRVLRLCELLFFGDDHRDASAFVLEDLGLTRFEDYALDGSRRLFEDRAALDRYLRLSQLNSLSHRLTEHPALAGWLADALWRPAPTRLEQRRRDRILNRLALGFERAGDIDAALSCYARSASHPSRERRTRLLSRLGDDCGATSLLERMRHTPRSAEEEDFARRFGRRQRGRVVATSEVALREAPPGSIEQHAANLLGAGGAAVFHLENHLPRGVAALAYWDVVFAELPGAFVNPFQSGPLDLFWADFAEARTELIAERSSTLADPERFRSTLIETHQQKQGIANRLISWRHFTSDVLQALLLGIPAGDLKALADHVIRQPYRTRTGFPDLVVIYGPGNYEFIEVKGPTDQLQPAQRVWFKTLDQLGQPARVLKFRGMLIRISVRTLAEFAHRRGDLYPPLGGRVTPEEGLAMQRQAQRHRGEHYRKEVRVEASFESELLQLTVSGRIDGCDLSRTPPLVEEIKATRAAAAVAEQHLGSAHWAQLILYAALLAHAGEAHERWLLRLLYCHPDSGVQTPFEQTWGSRELADFLADTVERYAGWMRQQAAWADTRNAWLNGLAFPYGRFRPHQRAMAARVYQAFQTGERLLLEAPTGSGKTMGILYPALKALATGPVDRLFYLTSRSTGAIAARDACLDLVGGSCQPRVVELIAKAKACPVAGMPCDDCDYSRGYYDRIREAVTVLLDHKDMHAERVQETAAVHRVCPFELSLDAALWADVIIGDYNYLLDPVVRLQRFAQNDRLGVLIDESHQLAERVRSMLSLTINRGQLRRALAESPPVPLMPRLKGVDRALLTLRRGLPEAEETVIEEPQGLLRAFKKALECLADAALDLTAFPETRLLMFELSRWMRSEAWRNDSDYRYLADLPAGRERRGGGGGRKQISVTLACLDPAAYLAETLGGYGPHVRFSGTLSPIELYQAVHGYPDSAGERVQSAFTPEQLAVLVVPDLSVYYRDRARTLPDLADLVATVCATRSGNYLLALPSFEYLDNVAAELADRQPGLERIVQTPGMNPQEQAEFLGQFSPDGSTRLGIIVLGGVFAESVDFSHAPLSGVICVGVGLPPPSAFRTEMLTHFDEAFGPGGGTTVALQQPAMARVLQMTGRLLRSPHDQGVVCLIDERFQRPAFQRFFPAHWQPEVTPREAVAQRLENFWRQRDVLPKLPTGEAASRPIGLQALPLITLPGPTT